MDPFVGKLGVFRVHQGTVTRDTQLFVGDGRKPFKVGHLFMLQGGQERRGRRARCRATSRRSPRSTRSNSTACCTIRTTRTTSTCGRSSFRRRCRASRSRPKKRGDEQRISEVLHRMTAEDPTLRRRARSARNETVLRALGELHLRSVLERMASQFKLEIDTRPPRIPYRETITAPGRRLPPAQEADRRRRAVRRGVAARRAAARAAPASSSSMRPRAA